MKAPRRKGTKKMWWQKTEYLRIPWMILKAVCAGIYTAIKSFLGQFSDRRQYRNYRKPWEPYDKRR